MEIIKKTLNLCPKHTHREKINRAEFISKITAEFTKGHQKMDGAGPCVAVFGSARTPVGTKYYDLAEEIGFLLAERGFGVITGGGPGLMEATNKGAQRGKGVSIGLNIELPFEGQSNSFVDQDKDIIFNYFFVRKVMFVKYACGFIVMPGGLGTLDELFEALTLIQTKKILQFPVVLVGSDFWKGLIAWMNNIVLSFGNISQEDFELFRLVDTAEEAIRQIEFFHERQTFKESF